MERKQLVTILISAVLTFVVLSTGCQHHQQVTLITADPLPIGEAIDCTAIDTQWMEAHCFPPAKLSVDKHKYIVEATFDAPVKPDSSGWSYDWTCRLDSPSKATCHHSVKR